MSDSLLGYFNRELDALRGLASEFAEKHPKIAGRLRLTKDAVDDPHVARLLEGVAFLGARVQHRLDDEFPELTDALLSVLYPHYLAPLPSVAIVRFDADPGMIGPARLPSGLAVEAEPVGIGTGVLDLSHRRVRFGRHRRARAGCRRDRACLRRRHDAGDGFSDHAGCAIRR